MTKTEKKPIGSGWWKQLLILAMGVLLVLDSIQLLNMSAVVNRVDKSNQGVIDEMGNFRGAVELFGTDLNEIRRFLLLPEKNYLNADGQPEENKEEQTTSASQLGIYAFMTQYSTEQKIEQNKQSGQKIYTDLSQNPEFTAKLQGLNVVWQNVAETEMQAKIIDKLAKNSDDSVNVLLDQPLFTVFFSAEENLFHVQSAVEDKTFAKYNDAGFVSEVSNYVAATVAQARVKKVEQKKQAELNANKAVEDAKTQTANQRMDFENTLHEGAFTQTLSDQGLKLADKSRDEDNKLIYDVLGTDGKVKFSFALEISSGMIKVIKDGQELNVEEFVGQDGLKKKP